MNSLEWINAEITKWQEILESFKEQLIRVKGTRNEETTLNHIEANELKLKYLQQIKTILEAWEIVKKDFILTWESPNDASGYYLKYFGDIEYETIKKALEVEDE